VAADGVVPEGRLLVRSGWLRATAGTVSSGVTADDVAGAVARGSRSLTETQRLDRVGAGLATLTLALYPHSPERDAAALDEAVRDAMDAARAATQGWPWARR
jgi:hypothetical protein